MFLWMVYLTAAFNKIIIIIIIILGHNMQYDWVRVIVIYVLLLCVCINKMLRKYSSECLKNQKKAHDYDRWLCIGY